MWFPGCCRLAWSEQGSNATGPYGPHFEIHMDPSAPLMPSRRGVPKFHPLMDLGFIVHQISRQAAYHQEREHS